MLLLASRESDESQHRQPALQSKRQGHGAREQRAKRRGYKREKSSDYITGECYELFVLPGFMRLGGEKGHRTVRKVISAEGDWATRDLGR